MTRRGVGLLLLRYEILRARYVRFVGSDWFKSNCAGRSLGAVVEIKT